MKIYSEFARAVYTRDDDMEVTFTIKGYINKTLANELMEGTLYRMTIDEVKSKRTLEQNRYMWALIHDIAEARCTDRATSEDSWNVYIEALQKAESSFYYVAVEERGLEDLKARCRAVKVLNRFTTEKGNEMLQCQIFIGSSQFDTKEMTKLIDVLEDMAVECGITLREQIWEYEVDNHR